MRTMLTIAIEQGHHEPLLWGLEDVDWRLAGARHLYGPFVVPEPYQAFQEPYPWLTVYVGPPDHPVGLHDDECLCESCAP